MWRCGTFNVQHPPAVIYHDLWGNNIFLLLTFKSLSAHRIFWILRSFRTGRWKPNYYKLLIELHTTKCGAKKINKTVQEANSVQFITKSLENPDEMTGCLIVTLVLWVTTEPSSGLCRNCGPTCVWPDLCETELCKLDKCEGRGAISKLFSGEQSFAHHNKSTRR